MLFLLENKHIVAVFNFGTFIFASLETAFLQVVNQVKSDSAVKCLYGSKGMHPYLTCPTGVALIILGNCQK
jgi:hypothetical protein